MALDKLIPFHKTHSISEVAFNLYLASPIIKPERFKTLLESGLSGEFDEFKIAYQQGVQLKFSGAGDPEIDIPERKSTGFRFNKFKDGKISWAIQANNVAENQGQFSVLSFHCLDPEYDWDVFLPKVKFFMHQILAFESSLFVKAIGLNYVDQFNWIGQVYPDLSEIFNKESEFIPKVFFRNASDTSFSFNGLCSEETNEKPYVEKVDVFSRTISSGNINLGIVHLIVKEFTAVTSLIDLLKNDSLSLSLNWAHDKNKSFLKNILNTNVINKIGLN